MSKLEQRAWFNVGKRESMGQFMLVIYDTLNANDYPVFVKEDELTETIRNALQAPMQRLLEVYDLRQDRDQQLNEARTWRVPDDGSTSD